MCVCVYIWAILYITANNTIGYYGLEFGHDGNGTRNFCPHPLI